MVVPFKCVGALVVVLATLALAGEESAAPQRDSEMMALAMAMSRPGPEHDRLARLEGKFKQQVTYWMEPGADPMVFSGEGENRMILGGRFLECRSTSGEGPMEIEGLTIIGFDRRFEHYTVTAYDTWCTHAVSGAGSWDQTQKAIVLSGIDHDPVLGDTEIFDMVIHFLDPDTFRWEVIFKDSIHTKGGGEFKAFEVMNTRVKSDD